MNAPVPSKTLSPGPHSNHNSDRYLEREHLSQYPNANIVLLRPSMSFMLIQTPNPTTLKNVLPNFTCTSHIFLPINDCRNVEVAEGGSHWSLLLVSIHDGVAFHYDSLHAANQLEAHKAMINLSRLLGRPFHFLGLRDAPQQENMSDCGVFVCLEMKHLLLNRLLEKSSNQKVVMNLGQKEINTTKGRREMLRIIEEFRKDGERRRS